MRIVRTPGRRRLGAMEAPRRDQKRRQAPAQSEMHRLPLGGCRSLIIITQRRSNRRRPSAAAHSPCRLLVGPNWSKSEAQRSRSKSCCSAMLGFTLSLTSGRAQSAGGM